MKTLAAMTTALLAALLVLTPALAFAATGTITVQTNAQSYSAGQTITITGTASPAPSGTAELIVQVTGPAGVVFREPATITSGSFSVPPFTAAGPDWVAGSYSVLAGGLAGYNNGTYTFTLTSTSVVSSSGLTLTVFASGSSLVTPGQTAAISALVVWNNETAASNVNFTGSLIISPSGAASAAPTPVAAGKGYWWSIPVTSSTPEGLYVVELKAHVGSTVAWGQASFTVNSGIASSSALSALGQQVNTLGSQISANFSKTWTDLSSMQTAITNAISSSQTAITNAITSAQSALSTAIGSATSAAQTAATDASNASSNVSNVTTYVLVVAILVAITLVLELAVLVRKLS